MKLQGRNLSRCHLTLIFQTILFFNRMFVLFLPMLLSHSLNPSISPTTFFHSVSMGTAWTQSCIHPSGRAPQQSHAHSA